MVRIAVVGNDDDVGSRSLSGINHLLHAVVNCPHGLFNCDPDARMPNHVAVGVVDYDEVIFLCADGVYQLVLDLVCAHLWLEVVGGYLWRWHEDAVLALIRCLATAVEEECHVGILLCLSYMKLVLAVVCKILAEGVLYILFVEEDMNSCKR